MIAQPGTPNHKPHYVNKKSSGTREKTILARTILSVQYRRVWTRPARRTVTSVQKRAGAHYDVVKKITAAMVKFP